MIALGLLCGNADAAFSVTCIPPLIILRHLRDKNHRILRLKRCAEVEGCRAPLPGGARGGGGKGVHRLTNTILVIDWLVVVLIVKIKPSLVVLERGPCFRSKEASQTVPDFQIKFVDAFKRECTIVGSVLGNEKYKQSSYSVPL